MRKSSTSFNSSLLSLNFKYLFLVTFALCASLVFSLDSKAQIQPPLECIALDDFENTQIPGNMIDLDAGGNPGPVNVLDNGAPGVIGDIRNITFGPTGNEAFIRIDNGNLIVNNRLINSAPLDLLYNANGTGLNLDFSNVSEFRFTLTSNDRPEHAAEIILIDSENNSAQTMIANLPNVVQGASFPVDITLPLSEFNGINGFDLSNIFSIEFRSRPGLSSTDYSTQALQICSPPTRDVPTLSQWGLIAMAGVLGIVSFMVMRRRKVAA